MGFKCPECNKDFGNDKGSFRSHMEGCRSRLFKDEDLLKVYRKEGRKMKTPSINAIQQAVEDGRLEVWVNWDGYIVIRNVHTGACVELECSRNYDGSKE